MPSSSTSVNPSRCTSAANACRSGRLAGIAAGASSQPSHCSSPEPVHTDASRAQMREVERASSQAADARATSPRSGWGNVSNSGFIG